MRFDSLVQALVDEGVEFAVIGGWSAILNGSVHTTRDLDICYRRGDENHKRLAAALGPFQPKLRDLPSNLPFVWDARTLANGTMFTLDTTAGAVDLIAEVPGIGTFEEVKAVSRLAGMFERQVLTLDLRALIASKRAAGRPKDLRMLPELESLLEASRE